MVPSDSISIGGPFVIGLSCAAITRPNFQVPASKTFGNVLIGISVEKFSATKSNKQIVKALHSTIIGLSTLNFGIS
jgi:hypothetical protein